jgi:ribonuclease P protein component
MILFIHMLPKKLRLSRQEFKDVMKDGKMASGKLMGILILRKKEEGKRKKEFSKAGLIVSKRLSNKAVVRNKLKRRLRAALQRILPDLSDIHFVILPNRRAIDATVEELKNEIVNILQK